MNARKVITVLSIVALLIVVAVAAVALFTIKKVEADANKKKTEPARNARWPKKEDSALSGTKSPAEQSENEALVEQENLMRANDGPEQEENI